MTVSARRQVGRLFAALLANSALAQQPPPTFLGDVLPLLQQRGCSSAYCHGSATGRGGFRLSLFGSDPDADWQALAVDRGSRRIDAARPEQSLVLRKATLQIDHDGGKRLASRDHGYALLREWIAAGAPPPDAAALPPALTLRSDAADMLQVTATFGDGTVRDVTRLATFRSTDERVVEVTPEGRMTLQQPGEAFVLARYHGADAALRVVQRPPAAPPRPPEAEPLQTAAHPADAAWLSWLRDLGLEPAPPAPPHRLVRRLYVDLLGRPPAPEETTTFVALPRDTAVATTVADLLQRREFVDTFAAHLAEWLELPADGDAAMAMAGVTSLRQQLHAWLLAGRTLDAIATLLLVPGSALLERFADPRDRADYVGRAFLGRQIACARCHDHPGDRWRQGDHLGFAALLATRRDRDGRIVPGSVFAPGDGAPVPPRMLPLGDGSAPLPHTEPGDALAPLRHATLTATDTFATNIGNRLLGVLLDRAPVEPPDDHRLSNPARCAPLLAAVVAHHRATGGDLRELVRFVVTSRLYQLDSEPDPAAPDGDEQRARWFARRSAQDLRPDQLARAIAFVLGGALPTSVPASPLQRELRRQNGDLAVDLLARRGNPIDAIADFSPDDGTAVAELFLHLLARPPRADEITTLLPNLAADRRAALHQLTRAICRSREFASRR